MPTTALLHGKVIGGGLALATAADHRLCLPNTTLNVALLPLGKSPVLMLMDSLPRVVGQGMASRLYLENSTVETEQAIECGLVDGVVSDHSEGERTALTLMQGSGHGSRTPHVNEAHSAKEVILLADLALKKQAKSEASARQTKGLAAKKQEQQDGVKTDVAHVVVRVVRSLLGIDEDQEIETSAPLMEMGLDSLAATELARELSQELRVKLSPTLLFDYPTVSDITRHLADLVYEDDDKVDSLKRSVDHTEVRNFVVDSVTQVVRSLLGIEVVDTCCFCI